MFGTLGWMEILLIFLIVMVLFGARKLPEIGKGLGKAITNFKRGVSDDPRQIEDDDEDEEEKTEEETKKSSK